MKTTGDQNKVIDYLLDIPLRIRFPKKKRTNPGDFGDDDDVKMIHLKRVGKDINSANFLKDYGVYLGQHGSQFVVGIKGNDSGLASCEMFDSLEELKTEWQID